MKQALVILQFTLFGTAGLTGCNTVAGVGEDVQAVGDGIQDAAN